MNRYNKEMFKTFQQYQDGLISENEYLVVVHILTSERLEFNHSEAKKAIELIETRK